MQTSEQRPFQGAENQRHGSPVKKASSVFYKWDYQDDLLNDRCFVPRRFALNRREGLLDPLNAQSDAALSTSA
jgi:hypothetical protein